MRLAIALVLPILITSCAVPPRYMSMTINASPGTFQQYSAGVRPPPGGSDTTQVLVKFQKLQPSDEWPVTITICLDNEDQMRDRTCLSLIALRNGPVLSGRVDRVGLNKPSRAPLLPKFNARDELLLRVEATETLARFFVNDVQLFESTTVQHPTRLFLACSSAICHFDVKE